MSCVLPLVLNERLVHSFKFYRNSQVHEGIRHNSVLYGFVCSFPSRHRLASYQLSCELAQAGAAVVTTVSDHGYKIWVDLTASEYLNWDSYLRQDLKQAAAHLINATIACLNEINPTPQVVSHFKCVALLKL